MRACIGAHVMAAGMHAHGYFLFRNEHRIHKDYWRLGGTFCCMQGCRHDCINTELMHTRRSSIKNELEYIFIWQHNDPVTYR